jgi:DNA (cytosine-5)-methyltransferase 1
MMGLPPGWVTDHLGRTAALRCIGNAVLPQVSALAWRVLSERITEQAA